jgi:hypothetical protein
MSWHRHRAPQYGGSAPATPGFNAVAPEWLASYGATGAAPAIPAAESTRGSHPCVALSSAQVLPEWINRNFAANRFPANGDNPLDCVSHSRGSLHRHQCPLAVLFPYYCFHQVLVHRSLSEGSRFGVQVHRLRPATVAPFLPPACAGWLPLLMLPTSRVSLDRSSSLLSSVL